MGNSEWTPGVDMSIAGEASRLRQENEALRKAAQSGAPPLTPEDQDERQWMFQWCVPYKGWGRVTFCAMPLDRAEELWRRSHPDQHDYEVWTPLKIVRGLTGPPQADAKAHLARAAHSPTPEGIDALAELVACKAMKDRLDEHWEHGGRKGASTADIMAVEADYRRRKPLAWAEARRVLAAHRASVEADPSRGAPAPLAPEGLTLEQIGRRICSAAAVFPMDGDVVVEFGGIRSRLALYFEADGKVRAVTVGMRDEHTVSEHHGHPADIGAKLHGPAAKPTPEVITVDRATATFAADHLDAEADCLRDSHTIRGIWSETPDDAEREAKADHDSMRACAAALRVKT